MRYPYFLFIVLVAAALSSADPARAAQPEAAFKLFEPGKQVIVDYAGFGVFKGIGTAEYQYVIEKPLDLAAAVGEGIFPNTKGLAKDPEFLKYRKAGKLEGSHWAFVNARDYQANFYRWASAAEAPGVKLFYTGLALENAGLIAHAIKAYYAVAVHFPRSIGLTFWGTPWYVGPASLDKIRFLTHAYPQLGIRLDGADILVQNRYDDDLKNDVFVVTPGKLVLVDQADVIPAPVPLASHKVAERKSFRSCELVRYDNGHWQMLVDGKPFMIKAIAYQPTKIGQSPDIGTLEDWSLADHNANGKIDAPYDSWVDKNRNNVQDPDEPAIGDFQILKDMGVNTIRVYHHTLAKNKALFAELYEKYGIRIMLGDYLGMYAVGSKAAWNPGTDYSNEEQQRNMLESVMEMVNAYKDEPCLLGWILGNENNYGTANNSKQFPRPYYRFVNEVAKKIKEVDPGHPVAICNGDIHHLDVFAQECQDVDIFGANTYRGNQGFGYHNFWLPVSVLTGKPAMVTEYGAPAYGRNFSRDVAEKYQADYLTACWDDIVANSAGYGAGISVGGSLFEFLDEWWKTGAPPGYPDIIQDVTPNCGGPFLDGWYYEEWFGVVGQGDGTDSPFLRQLRQAYGAVQKQWNETVSK